jgi:integrase
MKQTYPRYGRFALAKLHRDLSSSEKTILEEFLSYCAITAGRRKLDDIRRILIQFRDIAEKDFDEITLQDLRQFLALLNGSDRKEYTKNGIKAHVRRFLRWRFKDWSERFEEFRDVRLREAFNEEKINEGTLLKREQIESIVKKEKNFVRKAFFITLYESGLRPIELRKLTWKSVHLGGEGAISELHVFATKTGRARTVFVKEATAYLNRLFENREGNYVFPAIDDKNSPLSKSTCTRWVEEMGNAAGLKIFPYLLRHTRAHELYTQMPSKIAQKFMGHGSDMSELYAHISSKDIKESMLKTIYSFQEPSHEKKHQLELEIDKLRGEIDVIRRNFPLIVRILAQRPSVEQIEAVLKSAHF